jgi:hypothetical protein
VENKICFISCVNNEPQYLQCLEHINKLAVPEGVVRETVAIRDANSITSGYNLAMQKSNAKIKVYLHQDTWIVNHNFISDIREIFFKNPQIGLIGVVGAATLPITGIWSKSRWKYGQIIDSARDNILKAYHFRPIETEFQIVKCVDGLIMITQYDLPWRQDIFDGWHFYDASQCLEFNRAGYLVCVPQQLNPWCIHNCGQLNFANYDKYRYLFLKEYSKDLFEWNYPSIYWVNLYKDIIKKANQIVRPLVKRIEKKIKAQKRAGDKRGPGLKAKE